ncbi:uncharacterized protein LOC135368555 [Ornithodoros turicata]|uniref:uncharacterized protein LOC135368555 n=1 Tax=Ornithodoros turicata TaxID=34597 RepID=UPI00313971E8
MSSGESSWTGDEECNRPAWELEAEILRLTTRLMMRERDLKLAKQQIKQESTRSSQSAASWRSKVKQKDEQLKALLHEKDEEMKVIVSQLLLLEGQLRKEQQRIEKILEEKDAIIRFQRHELVKLKKDRMRSQRHLDRVTREESIDSLSSLPVDSKLPVATVTAETQTQPEDLAETSPKSLTALQQLRSDLIRSRAVQDLTNLPSNHAKKDRQKSTLQITRSEGDDQKARKLERDECMDEFLEEKDLLRIEELAVLHETQHKRRGLYIQRSFGKIRDIRGGRMNVSKAHKGLVGVADTLSSYTRHDEYL